MDLTDLESIVQVFAPLSKRTVKFFPSRKGLSRQACSSSPKTVHIRYMSKIIDTLVHQHDDCFQYAGPSIKPEHEIERNKQLMKKYKVYMKTTNETNEIINKQNKSA